MTGTNTFCYYCLLLFTGLDLVVYIIIIIVIVIMITSIGIISVISFHVFIFHFTAVFKHYIVMMPL